MLKDKILEYKKEFEHWLIGGDIKVYYKNDTKPEWLTPDPEVAFDPWDIDETLIVIDDEYVELRKALAHGKIIQWNCNMNKSHDYWSDICDQTDIMFTFYTPEIMRIKPEEPKFPCYFKEKHSGIIVYFKEKSKEGINNSFGIVIASKSSQIQKTLGFTWRCWDTFSNPERWEKIEDYVPKFKIGDIVRYIHANNKIPLKIVNINSNLYYFHNASISLRKDEIKQWTPEPGELCWLWNKSKLYPILSKFKKITAENRYECEYWSDDFEFCEPFMDMLPEEFKHLKQ